MSEEIEALNSSTYHRQESMQTQHVVVMRHGERLDDVQADWSSTAKRPWDTPLSMHGLCQAQAVGTQLQALGFPITRVYSSPFQRCLQTAVQACRSLDTASVHVCWELSEALFRIRGCPQGQLCTWLWLEDGPPEHSLLAACCPPSDGIGDSPEGMHHAIRVAVHGLPYLTSQEGGSADLGPSSGVSADESPKSGEAHSNSGAAIQTPPSGPGDLPLCAWAAASSCTIPSRDSAGSAVHPAAPPSPPVGSSHHVCPLAPEPAEKAQDRFRAVLSRLANAHPGENILLVTHGDAVGHSVTVCHPGAVAYEVSYTGFVVAVRTQVDTLQEAVLSSVNSEAPGEPEAAHDEVQEGGSCSGGGKASVGSGDIWSQMAAAAAAVAGTRAECANLAAVDGRADQESLSMTETEQATPSHAASLSSQKSQPSASDCLSAGDPSAALLARGAADADLVPTELCLELRCVEVSDSHEEVVPQQVLGNPGMEAELALPLGPGGVAGTVELGRGGDIASLMEGDDRGTACKILAQGLATESMAPTDHAQDASADASPKPSPCVQLLVVGSCLDICSDDPGKEKVLFAGGTPGMKDVVPVWTSWSLSAGQEECALQGTLWMIMD